ncbi:Mersacidin decarboxylase [Bacillus cereus]|uniref:flavoprotein n=1 Tax=Bacillus sp. BB56-3 TaxID=2217831 RepID=UPI0011EFA56F|nr:flavoprotein [Bacillus sp. BB56-3]KAA0800281.1 Mersacidin decarboxylase [Bacillus sp. BB56-3]MCU4757457.1 Mersacidin decarboxylase [Bacillus cereus]
MNIKNFKEEGNLLIGACGSINIVNLPGCLSYLKTNLCKNIKVILTDQACSMVSESSLGYIIGNDVFTTFDKSKEFAAPHISLTRWADIFLILPASANIIGKAANGIADDLLSSSLLSSNCPVVFYPNMNKHMWTKNSVQRNVSRLKDDGYYFIENESKVFEIASGKDEDSMTVNILKIPSDVHSILNQ